MTHAVIDASVAVKLIFPERFSDHAERLFNDLARVGEPVVAPYLLPVEVTNVIRGRMRADQRTLVEASAQLERFLSYPIALVNPAGLHHRALALTEAHSLGAHDAHYVALAQLLACELWTDDQRILRATGGRLPFVRGLGDFPASAGA
jgi:predicted nucleic acid-binding protein